MSYPDDPASTSGGLRGIVGSPHLLWGSWLLGAAVLAGVVAVALHLSEAEAFTHLIGQAHPFWFLLAVLLQALTYPAQGQIYRLVVRASGAELALGTACRLGLMKLFVDQALPSCGVSGALAVTAAFERSAVERPVVFACLVIGVSSYLLAYVLLLGLAVGIVAFEGFTSGPLLAACALFALVSLTVALSTLLLAGRRLRHSRGGWLGRGLAMLWQADARLVRNPRLLVRVLSLDLLIFLLDGSTLWLLVRALGEPVGWSGVFAGYMLASVLRSIGVTPGGMGVFEAGAVATLHWAGVSLAVALSAILLFRGLSFWLPMLPGLLITRSAIRSGRQPTR